MSTPSDKQTARRLVQARLSALPPDEYREKSEIVRENVRNVLKDRLSSRESLTVLSYIANPDWREVDLSLIERQFSGIRFDHVPTDAKAPFPSEQYDVILIPLYGFNAEGYRLGHGSGWYDRFLATQPLALKVGVGLEVNRVKINTQPHDVPMDMVITEEKVAHIG